MESHGKSSFLPRNETSNAKTSTSSYFNAADRLSIALAIVIVRNAPPDCRAKDYAVNLQKYYAYKNNYWRDKSQRLEDQVRALEEQLSLVRLSERVPWLQNVLQERLSGSSTDILTPPLTQQTPSTSVPAPKALIWDQTSFIRSHLYLSSLLNGEKQLLASDRESSSYLRRSVQAILSAIDKAMSCRNNTVSSNDYHASKLLNSLETAIKCCQPSSVGKLPEVQGLFIEAGAKWLAYIDQGDSAKSIFYYAALEILAKSLHSVDRLTETVLRFIAGVEKRLASQTPASPALVPSPILKTFTRSSYFFMLLEQLISRLQSTDNQLQSYVNFLTEIHPVIESRFPLFAALMLRSAHHMANNS